MVVAAILAHIQLIVNCLGNLDYHKLFIPGKYAKHCCHSHILKIYCCVITNHVLLCYFGYFDPKWAFLTHTPSICTFCKF